MYSDYNYLGKCGSILHITTNPPDDFWSYNSTNGKTLSESYMVLIQPNLSPTHSFPTDGLTVADVAKICEEYPEATEYFEEYAEWRLFVVY
jgi:hypothetical protein